jgi:hypothetical protein
MSIIHVPDRLTDERKKVQNRDTGLQPLGHFRSNGNDPFLFCEVRFTIVRKDSTEEEGASE